MNFHYFIPYVNRPDLLLRAVCGLDNEAISRLVILDNSPGGLRLTEYPGAIVLKPPVPLSFTQTMNWMIALACEWKDDVIVWQHNDAAWHPGACSEFLVEVARIHAGSVDWGVIFTSYDAVSALSVSACLQVGPWDTAFWQYQSDIDFYIRLKKNLFKVNPLYDLGKQVNHDIGQTIYSDPFYYRRNHEITPGEFNYYRAKWGGDNGSERFLLPFDGQPHREEFYRLRSTDVYQKLTSTYYSGEGNILEITEEGTAVYQIEALKRFLRVARPQRVLETGTAKALFAYLLSRLVPGVELVTVDGDSRSAVAADLARTLLPEIILTFHPGDSRMILPQLEGPFDLAWIDGGHSYEVCLSDLRQAFRLDIPWILADDGKLESVTEACQTALAEDSRYRELSNPYWNYEPRGMRFIMKKPFSHR